MITAVSRRIAKVPVMSASRSWRMPLFRQQISAVRSIS